MSLLHLKSIFQVANAHLCTATKCKENWIKSVIFILQIGFFIHLVHFFFIHHFLSPEKMVYQW